MDSPRPIDPFDVIVWIILGIAALALILFVVTTVRKGRRVKEMLAQAEKETSDAQMGIKDGPDQHSLLNNPALMNVQSNLTRLPVVNYFPEKEVKKRETIKISKRKEKKA